MTAKCCERTALRFEARLDALRDALGLIRHAGNNADPTAIWMQKIAAHALEPEKWPHPGGQPSSPAPDAPTSNEVIPEVEEAWEMVIDACQQAWPDRKPLVYSDSPTELIIEIINERDELRAELDALKASRVETPAEPPPCPHCLEAHALIDAEPCDSASGNIADRVGDVIEQLHEAWAQLATWQESCTGKHGSQQRCIDAVPAVKTAAADEPAERTP